jgi:hypothetical protein
VTQSVRKRLRCLGVGAPGDPHQHAPTHNRPCEGRVASRPFPELASPRPHPSGRSHAHCRATLRLDDRADSDAEAMRTTGGPVGPAKVHDFTRFRCVSRMVWAKCGRQPCRTSSVGCTLDARGDRARRRLRRGMRRDAARQRGRARELVAVPPDARKLRHSRVPPGRRRARRRPPLGASHRAPGGSRSASWRRSSAVSAA